jgi:MFS family permease
VRLGTVIACAAQFLIGVDGLAVAIALPALRDDLGADPLDAQWVLTAFGLTFGGALLLGGRLGDLYGRRRLLVVGMTAFAAGSLAAALAPTLAVLVAARAVQGVGAAASIPASLALIGSFLPEGRARTRALSAALGLRRHGRAGARGRARGAARAAGGARRAADPTGCPGRVRGRRGAGGRRDRRYSTGSTLITRPRRPVRNCTTPADRA